jgi:hypothetical protein
MAIEMRLCAEAIVTVLLINGRKIKFDSYTRKLGSHQNLYLLVKNTISLNTI